MNKHNNNNNKIHMFILAPINIIKSEKPKNIENQKNHFHVLFANFYSLEDIIYRGMLLILIILYL